MSQIKSIALAALLIGASGLSGHLVNAASPNRAQANTPAQAQVYAQANPADLSLRPAQEPAATSQDTNPWAVTATPGAHFQSRAGFVGYH